MDIVWQARMTSASQAKGNQGCVETMLSSFGVQCQISLKCRTYGEDVSVGWRGWTPMRFPCSEIVPTLLEIHFITVSIGR